MERLTSNEKRISGQSGVCCTHFNGFDCYQHFGDCANGCPWNEAAWKRLAAYEDTGLTPEEIQEAVDLFPNTDDIPSEIKSWVERCTWHVRKCSELSSKLAEYESRERACKRDGEAKICELKIQSCEDRANIAAILAFAGYKVSIEERGDIFSRKGREYYVIVEDKGTPEVRKDD